MAFEKNDSNSEAPRAAVFRIAEENWLNILNQYVIAIDEPNQDGEEATIRLVPIAGAQEAIVELMPEEEIGQSDPGEEPAHSASGEEPIITTTEETDKKESIQSPEGTGTGEKILRGALKAFKWMFFESEEKKKLRLVLLKKRSNKSTVQI